MADSQRSLEDLLVLFADNNAGDITAQWLRDALVSALGGYGGLSVAGGAAAQVIGTVPVKVTAWTANLPSSGVAPDHTTDSVLITVDGDYIVTLAVTGTSTAARLAKLAIYKNGAPVAGVASVRRVATGTDVGGWPIAAIVSCSASDVLTVYGSADVDATSLTLMEGALTVRRLS